MRLHFLATLALAFAATVFVRAQAAASEDPVSLVDPLIGTSGSLTDGPSDTFPGADAPFGMIQWSPDTTSQPSGGGYLYNDNQITGFSLTHLSGPGCNVFGDVGMLPTVGAVDDPAEAKQAFTHVTEIASPGYYSIMLGAPPIRTQLAVTQRAGLGSFTFPATPQANLLVNASSNQSGLASADVRVAGNDEIIGSATAGWFCDMPGTYTIYFALRFNRPFSAFGTWQGTKVTPSANEASGVRTGAWATFDASNDPSVEVKAAVSWVSVAGAEANLRAEATTWDIERVRRAAAAQWRSELGRVRVDGGTRVQQRIFYTALYHAMLHPNVYSDADGQYRGFDGRVHLVDKGHTEYATFSGWDIYRTEVPLLALLDPRRTSDMMRSLVHAAQQSGWLPKWSLVNVETAVMGGDPSDPMIAGAYAFGAKDFDANAALAAMLKGATQAGGTPGQGWYVERPALDEYLARGYVVNRHTTNVAPVANGASLTLEYALDDFSIAQLAKALGNRNVYGAMMARAQNWSNLFDRSSGLILPRDRDGAFLQLPITENGQSGFQEGNAAQYTWMVPQNLTALIDGMGGTTAANARLDAFFAQLDSGPDKPYAWLGNEPTIGSPWAYLAAGAPWKAQRVIRDAMTQLWGDTPDGIPGNDDLGTMSAWYVWCALGMYPQNPAAPILDLGAPLFTSIAISVPGGANIRIDAPAASTDNAYVESLRINGKSWTRSWMLFQPSRAMQLSFVLASTPNPRWAASPAAAPPSYALGQLHFPASTLANFSMDSGELVIGPGRTSTMRFGMTSGEVQPVSVSWHVELPDGLRLNPPSGRLDAGSGSASQIDTQLSVENGINAGIYDIWVLGTTDAGAVLPRAVAVVRVQRPGQTPALAYAANYFDNTITPIDPQTHAFGAPIVVGENPRDLVVSPDGKRVYVTDQGAKSVSVVDTATRSVTATVKIGNGPWGIAIAPDGATLWVANTQDNAVVPIDTATLTVGTPIHVGNQPASLAVSRDGAMLFVANQGSNDVTPVDLRRRVALDPIPVGARPRGIAVSPDGKEVYASNMGSNSVTPIDATTRKAGPQIPVGVAPRGLTFTPDGKWLYVANFATNTVTPIDVAAHAPLAPIAVGLNPVAITFDQTGTAALVVNAGDNDCVAVDVRTRSISEPIPLGNRPISIAR